jgi:hypothetical protein
MAGQGEKIGTSKRCFMFGCECCRDTGIETETDSKESAAMPTPRKQLPLYDNSHQFQTSENSYGAL